MQQKTIEDRYWYLAFVTEGAYVQLTISTVFYLCGIMMVASRAGIASIAKCSQ